MRCVLEPDLAVFAERVMPFLFGDRVRHCLLLTLLDARLNHGVTDPAPPVGAYVDSGGGADAGPNGEIVGVALRTPPWPWNVSVMPSDAASLLARTLAAADPEAPGMSGPADPVEVFARHYGAHTGRPVRAGMRMRMYALGQLQPPTSVPGMARRAGTGDIDLLTRWWHEFERDSHLGAPAGNAEQAVRARLDTGELHLWEVDGVPVAMASSVGPTFAVARVGGVYTPPEHRCHGYGGAVTAATTLAASQRGAEEVMLYADLDFPTSNSIYQRLGYQPVGDVLTYHLEDQRPE